MRFPAGSIQSADDADRALSEVKKERAAIETRFAGEERDCSSRFFINTCTDVARERRRAAMTSVRAVEIEANALKREMRVSQREKELAEKQLKISVGADVGTAPVSADKEDAVADSALRDMPGNVVRSADAATPATVATQPHKRPTAAPTDTDRSARITAYDKKVGEAQARQRQVEARKAEREKKRLAKAAKAPPRS